MRGSGFFGPGFTIAWPFLLAGLWTQFWTQTSQKRLYQQATTPNEARMRLFVTPSTPSQAHYLYFIKDSLAALLCIALAMKNWLVEVCGLLAQIKYCQSEGEKIPWGTAEMFTVPELAADALGSHLAAEMGHRFGSTEAGLIERVQSAARLAIDCIGGSDALYHNVEHTMLVTLVGLDILRGRQLLVETSASDFEHFIVACLFHDIGYVRGILKGDSADGYIIDAKANKVELPRGSSDAALMPYRVDRSKLFVMDRVGQNQIARRRPYR